MSSRAVLLLPVAAVVLSSQPAAGQAVILYRPTIAGVVTRQLASASRNLMSQQIAVADANAELEALRKEYWAAFAAGRLAEDLKARFGSALWAKDLYHLAPALAEGVRSIPFATDDRRAALRRLAPPIDGGVRRQALVQFEAWVESLRYHLGARGPSDPVLVASPVRFEAAFEKSIDYLANYLRARDWAEFEASGLDINKHLDAKSYALRMLESHLGFGRRGARTGSPAPPIAEDALAYYDVLVRALGERPLLSAANEALRLPKNKLGLFDSPSAATPQSPATVIPVSYFFTKLWWQPKGYALQLLAPALVDGSRRWNEALSEYQRIVAKYGEARVLAVAKRIQEAPKILGRLGSEGDEPRVWFAKLLESPDTPLPAGPKRYTVADFAVMKAAKQASNEIAVILEGIVSHVTRKSGGGAIVNFILHFSDSPDDSVTVRLLYDHLSDDLRADAQGRVNRRVQVVTRRSWILPDGRLMFDLHEPEQLRVLPDER